jgi:methionyl aminopeptidase
MAIVIKNADAIQGMRVAGRLASEVLDMLAPHVRPGVTTREIDRLAHEYIVKVQGGTPATLGYAPPGYPAYPASLCTSLNDVVCHGIPDDRPLKNGDIVNIDVTVIKDGWHGDNSRMYVVGEGSTAARRLSSITFEAMWKGIAKVRPGARLGDIGHAIQTFAEHHGYSVVREFCGHGVGARFHEEPQVLHYGRPGTLEELVPGMIFTIEPMINAGRREVKEDRNARRPYDGWTIVTRDRSLSAQWEHTVLVTDTGYEVLTCSAGSPPAPAFAPSGYGKPLPAPPAVLQPPGVATPVSGPALALTAG